MKNWTYLLVNIGSILIPLLFTFHPKIRFYKHWKATVLAILTPTLLFIPWDMVFTNLRVWGFNKAYLLGIAWLGLPLEELLFFICIPYACLFTYFCLKKYSFSKKVSSKISTVILIVLTLAIILFFDKMYTITTSILLIGFIIYHENIRKSEWLGHFYFSYMVLLIPFFITNGILTGTGLESPIVWYDNTNNIGIRLLSIPVEDVFYGALLIGLNVMVFERTTTQQR